MARLIRRCLEKDPQRRLQTARDIGNELGEIAAARPSTRGRAAPRAAEDFAVRRADEGIRVAVLPFRYSGGSADLAALAEGLSEVIVTALLQRSLVFRNSESRHESRSVAPGWQGATTEKLGIFEGGATQPAGMRRPRLMSRITVSGH